MVLASRQRCWFSTIPITYLASIREVAGELRWQTIGMVKGMQVLLVAHTLLESGDAEVVRVISARKATPQERRIYAQNN